MFEIISEFFTSFSWLIKIILGIVIFVAFCFASKPLTSLLLKITGRIFFSKNEQLKDAYITGLARPVRILFIVIGLFIGIYINYAAKAVLSAFQISVILIISWCIVSFISENLTIVFNIDNETSSINSAAIKFISNTLKVIIVLIAIVMVISELGYNISGLITGLGIGGLAISLAAQNTLQDFISGFVLVFDRPFNVGDMIETGDIKGVVEDITMRSTRIRQLDDTVVIVPNTTLSNASIINYAVLTKRLFDVKVGLLYSTQNTVINKCEEEIKNYLIEREDVENETIRVRFIEYGESSLNLEVRCYIDTLDIEEFYKITEEINYKIKEIIENNKTEFAYDTKSIIIENNNNHD